MAALTRIVVAKDCSSRMMHGGEGGAWGEEYQYAWGEKYASRLSP